MTAPPKKISFVIVNYNTKNLLVKCVKNLVAIWPNQEIIVVDNASTDGSVAAVTPFIENDVIKLLSVANNGLAASQNIGLAASSGEYVCYLGTDAYPTHVAITKLYEFMEANSTTGIVTPKLVLRDGTVDMDAHRGFPTPWAAFTHFTRLNRLFPKSKIFNTYFLGWENLSEPHEIDACISHFMFTRRSIHDVVGTWDEDYFLYGEDIDFCYRAKAANLAIYYVPAAEVPHYKGAGVGRKVSQDLKTASSQSKEVKLKVAASSTEAMRLFYMKHYSTKYPKWLTGLVLLVVEVLRKVRTIRAR
jgi:GT2 family glycosyltransferase